MSEEVKCLELEDYPRWYNLRYVPGEVPAIHVIIHKDCLATLHTWKPTDTVIRQNLDRRELEDDLFGKFEWDWNSPAFGIGNSIVRACGVGDYVTYRVKFPKGWITLPKDCKYCEGTGKNHHLDDRKCISCEGAGKERIIDWKEVYRAALSIVFLLVPLDRPPAFNTSSEDKQLAIINIAVGEFNALYGNFSPRLNRLLCEDRRVLSSKICEKAIQASMVQAAEYVCGERGFDGHSIRVDIEPGRFALHACTTGCMVYTKDSTSRYSQGLGCELLDTEIDSPLYLFPLLAGMATFMEVADTVLGKEMPHSLVS